MVVDIQIDKETLENSFVIMKVNEKQYKVIQNDIVKLEKIEGVNAGDKLGRNLYSFFFKNLINKKEFRDISLIGTDNFSVLGRPSISFCKVLCSVIEQTNSEKVIVFKKKRRKGYKKTQGHKQTMTVVQVDQIVYTIPEEISTKAICLV